MIIYSRICWNSSNAKLEDSRFITGTNVFSSDFSGLPCLLHLYTRLHLSDYSKFWNTERWKSFDYYFCIKQLFKRQIHLPKWRWRFVKNRWRLLTKSWTFFLVQIIRLCSNLASLWHKHLLLNYKWNFRLPISAFATVTRNILLEHQFFTRIFTL